MRTVVEAFVEEKELLPCLEIQGKLVYYKEIVHSCDLAVLYENEKPLYGFKGIIHTETSRPFITLLAEKRHLAGINSGDVVLVRICREKQEVEFVTKVREWGQMNIPKAILDLLEIKSQETILVNIMAKAQNLINITDAKIDLAQMTDYDNGVKVIPRALDFVTVYRKQKVPITLPRFIELSPKLVELFFLIHGDGHYAEKLYFANKSPELHKFVMNEFENMLRIPKNLWRSRILLHDLENTPAAKEYWQSRLELNDVQFYNASKCVLNTDATGNLRIILDKTIVSLIFRYVFEIMKKNLNKITALHALNGLLAAEGGAQISKKGLHRLTLSHGQKEKELFKKILHNSRTSYLWKDVQDKMFVIESWPHLRTFFKVFLDESIIPFRIHSERRKRAVEGFLKHSFTKTMSKYLTCINQNNNVTVEKLSTFLKIRGDSILDTLRKSQYAQFVYLKGRGVNRSPFIIAITYEGTEFLLLISRLEKCE